MRQAPEALVRPAFGWDDYPTAERRKWNLPLTETGISGAYDIFLTFREELVINVSLCFGKEKSVIIFFDEEDKEKLF